VPCREAAGWDDPWPTSVGRREAAGWDDPWATPVGPEPTAQPADAPPQRAAQPADAPLQRAAQPDGVREVAPQGERPEGSAAAAAGRPPRCCALHRPAWGGC
jgi:hypothetical protein